MRNALKKVIKTAIRCTGFDLVRYTPPQPVPVEAAQVPEPPVPAEPAAPPDKPQLPEGERQIRIGDKSYLIASDDNYLRNLGDEFEPQTVRLFKSLLPAQANVLDVGGNIGCTAIFFGEHAHRVAVFEPSPSTCEFLRTNVRRAGLANIDVHNYALGAQAGQAELAFAPDNRAGAFVSGQTKGDAGLVRESIVVRRLDEAMPGLGLPRIDLLKLDVEGFEKSVIEGARACLQEYKPVAVMELNHWCLNALQRTSVPDFLDYLKSVFPIVLAVDGDQYADLNDNDDCYRVMYLHIIKFRFGMIVAAFHPDQLAQFRGSYRSVQWDSEWWL